MHLETVELSIEGSGAPLSMKIPLISGKLHVYAIEKALDAKKLSLVTINGIIPVPDGDGFSQQRYSPADSITIQAAPKPGVCGMLLQGGLRARQQHRTHNNCNTPSARVCLL